MITRNRRIYNTIYYYNIGAPEHFGKVSNTEMMGLSTLDIKRGIIKKSPE